MPYKHLTTATLILFIIQSGPRALCQDPSNGDTLEISTDRFSERFLEGQTADEEESQLPAKLARLEVEPVDLNTAEIGELLSIPYISTILAENIITYRKKHKKFVSVSEIRNIEGFDEENYGIISKMTTVSSPSFGLRMRSRFACDIQPAYGYLRTGGAGYLGSREKLFNRLDLFYSRGKFFFSAGLVTEKDAGEGNLLDFFSGFAEMKSSTFLSQLIAGDYIPEFGQGITLWGVNSVSKGCDAVSIVDKRGGGITPHMSANEVQFFRGGALKLSFSSKTAGLNIFGFYSAKSFDASLDPATGEISTAYTDGNHRTAAEILRKDSAKEYLFGARFECGIRNASIGLTYYKTDFSRPFKHKNFFEFSGRSANAIGADFNLAVRNVNFFGEWAKSYAGTLGGISGVRFLFIRNAEIVITLRNYPKNFIMRHSGGFGEKNDTKNEFGIYSGIRIKLPGAVTLDAYYDQYKHIGETAFNTLPASGRDVMLYAEWKLTKDIRLYTKYRNRINDDAAAELNEFGLENKRIYTRVQSNYRFQFDYELSKNLRVRSRFEYVFVDNPGNIASQNGILFYSDVRVRPQTGMLTKKLTIEGRFIIFHTDSYESRIYEYESELDGVMTNQGMFGKGGRWYIIFRLGLLDNIQISGKYSETYIDGAGSIGSGNEEVKGDVKNRLAVQLELKF